jgi:Fur family zinc uptake transcriptional regulator
MNERIKKLLSRAELLCEQMKARLTPIRRDLLAQIYAHETHLTAYELLRLLRPAYPKVEAMTVYRALDFLQKQQLIHRVASQNAYTACETPQQHHHAQLLLCEKCGHAQEVSMPLLENVLRKMAEQNQFVLSDKPVEIPGACKNCVA